MDFEDKRLEIEDSSRKGPTKMWFWISGFLIIPLSILVYCGWLIPTILAFSALYVVKLSLQTYTQDYRIKTLSKTQLQKQEIDSQNQEMLAEGFSKLTDIFEGGQEAKRSAALTLMNRSRNSVLAKTRAEIQNQQIRIGEEIRICENQNADFLSQVKEKCDDELQKIVQTCENTKGVMTRNCNLEKNRSLTDLNRRHGIQGTKLNSAQSIANKKLLEAKQ